MAGINPRKVLEGVVDLVVYAPLGLAATVVEELPGLVDKGKSRLVMARTIGQFAVVMGRQRVEKAIADRRGGSGPASPAPAGVPEESPPAASGEPGDGPAAQAGASDDAPARTAPDARGGPEPHVGGPSAEGLAIPGYGSLAASQVVQRLAGLSHAELEAVRDYEEATRGRRTILGRIAQLTASRGEPESE